MPLDGDRDATVCDLDGITASSRYCGSFVWRPNVPHVLHVSHEGLAFDENNTLYFVDELNGGSIYKLIAGPLVASFWPPAPTT
jgi:uncharacterized protein